MHWRQTCADTSYAERKEALGKRSGERCVRAKGGKRQSRVWDVVVLSIRGKWEKGKRWGSEGVGEGRQLSCEEIKCDESRSDGCREPDIAASPARGAESLSNFGSSGGVNGRVTYSKKTFFATVMEVTSPSTCHEDLTKM